MNTEAIWLFLSTQGADFGLKILAAIAAWVLGRWLISLALRIFSAALLRGHRIDSTLATFIDSSGIAFVLQLHLAASEERIPVTLLDPHRVLREVLEMVGLSGELPAAPVTSV